MPFLRVQKFRFLKTISKKDSMNPMRKKTSKKRKKKQTKNLPHNFFIIYELEGKRNKREEHIYSRRQYTGP